MQTNALDFLAGGGEMGARMRAKDWSQTPLGPAEAWPQNLKTCVRIVLTSRQPMFVWWGESLINLYNDAYTSILRGGKHPQALGQAARDVWREIWPQIGPRAERTMAGNEGTYDEALLLLMERDGTPEETYYTFSYSPVPNEQGGTGGIICANTEDTRRIIGERQLALLRELASRTAEARRIDDAIAFAAAALETDAHDLPLALIYRLDLETRMAALAATAGLPRGHRAAPELLALEMGGGWPLAEVAEARDSRLVNALAERFGELPTGAWDRPPSRALVLPIPLSGMSGRAAALVVGLSPYRALDGNYRGFLDLVARQIGSSIANAHAYEQEKNRAEMLATLDRAKTAFFSNVSHEFRTPLTLMLGPTEDAIASQPQALVGENLLTVHRNALRLLRLVNALLDFSRLEAGRAQASYRPTDLAALTADLASAFRSAVERAGLAYDVECPLLPEPMFVDHDMWEKIVLNLLSNAVKFTFAGAIALRLGWHADGAELTVKDTGTGIPESDLPHVFERFRRVQGARARTHEGSGIGLALVHELVNLHGGSVRIESRVDEGTTVTVTIPRGSSHLPGSAVNTDATLVSTATGPKPYVEEALRWLPPEDAGEVRLTPPGGRPGETFKPNLDTHILLADDNADMRDYLARMLRTRWSVEAVGDGAVALAAARNRTPNLVLTDVMMPVLDGFGLMRELRRDARTKDVPVIMLSARAGEEARIEGLEAGADDYLTKPFSARELLARVSTHLQIARLRKTAEDASRAKDDFLSTLSHELRTPLNAIVGWATLLRGGGVAEAQLPKVFETIERNARVQARLIEDLLDLSRIEQGKLVLSVGPVEMVRVIEAAIEAVRPAADAKGVRVQPVLDSHATIVGDADRLQQVAWNLLANAIKFTPAGGRVQVRLHRQHSYVELAVADNGQGIDSSFLPHVFDRFRQADPSSTRKAGGLGLGLAIVRSLVELHGGTVVASSEGPGRGATFVVRLPTAPLRSDRAAPAGSTPSPKPPTFECPPELRGLRVLVVDDEPDTRALLEYVLVQCESHVTQAGSATEALDALERGSFDLLVSDVGMPGEDGLSLIRKVRALSIERGGRIPALALTAYARSEDRTAAFKAGFDMHLSKPIAPAEFLVVVERLVSGHGRR